MAVDIVGGKAVHLPEEPEQTFKPNPHQPPPPRKGRWALPSDDLAQNMCVVRRRPDQPEAPTIIPIPKSPKVQPQAKPVEIPSTLLMKLDRWTYSREKTMRLIQQVARKNPDKSGKWCAEKALWDLERDRH